MKIQQYWSKQYTRIYFLLCDLVNVYFTLQKFKFALKVVNYHEQVSQRSDKIALRMKTVVFQLWISIFSYLKQSHFQCLISFILTIGVRNYNLLSFKKKREKT